MNATAARALVFVLAGVAVFAVALGIGRLAGPIDSGDEAANHGDPHDSGKDDAHGGHAEPASGPAAPEVAGLQAEESGFSLHLAADQLEPGRRQLAFQVLGPGSRPVVGYDVQHEKRLHLIVVRRDLTGFQHVHPRLTRDGSWRVPVDLTPGTWRVIADFKPAGRDPLVLGTDLHVPGSYDPRPFGAERTVSLLDGYEVRLHGDTSPAVETVVTTTVTRAWRPVTDLQPYLGAHGHLVALRAGDLGYLHVHPDEAAGAGPDIPFHTTFPTAGRYRLFLDFRHADEVRTAAFTVHVGGPTKAAEEADHDH